MARSLFGVRVNPAHSADQRILVEVRAANGDVLDAFQTRANVHALGRASGYSGSDSFDIEVGRLVKAAERNIGSKMYVDMVRWNAPTMTLVIELTGRYRKNGMNVASNAARGVERRGALSREMHELEENRELARHEQVRQTYLRELEKVKRSVHSEILEKGARLRDYVRSPSGSPLSTRAAEQWVYRHAPNYGLKPKSMYELFWKTLRDYHADEVADYLVHKANNTSTGAAAELLGRAVDSAAEILASEAPRVTIQ